MGFLSKEQYYLSEVITDEAVIRISGQASEWESDEFLEEEEVLLLVVVEFVEGVELVRGRLEPQNQVVSQKLHDILVKQLVLLIAAIRLDEDVLKTEFRAVFRVDDQVPKELAHVGLKDVSEVDRVVDLGKYKHEVLQVSPLVRLLVRVQIVVVEDLEDLQAVLQDAGQDPTLIRGQVSFGRNHVINGL